MKKLLLFLLLSLYAFPALCVGNHGGTLISPTITINGLNWGSYSNTGTYTLAPGLTNYTVQIVNGNTPSIGDLNSLWYHHHTRTAVDSGGRVWVAYSGSLTAESQSGMITEVNSDAAGDGWANPYGPQIVIQPPGPFIAGFNNPQSISYPRAFVTYQGQLYLVAAIDSQPGGCCSDETGLALVATAMNLDGSIGTPFLISTATYTPIFGYPSYTYNSTLGPPLYTQANNFGVWGGSAPGYPQSAWTGYAGTTIANGSTFVEPSTININNAGKTLLRMWRCVSGGCTQNVFYMSRSLDYGSTWSVLTKTNVPNSPSASGMMILADGRIAMVANNVSNDGTTGGRDPLYLALFNGQTGAVLSVYAVRQGLSGVPQYNNGSNGGAQYPSIAEDSNGLIWISYSISKQTIGVTSIPASGL